MQTEKQWISSEILFTAILEQLKENRKAVFIVTGMSMWPFLCHGRDQVVIEKCDLKKLTTGDIVLFQTNQGHYLLHRITKIENGKFQSTGDGNCFRDGWFELSCIRAKVAYLIRKDKRIDCDLLRWKIVFKLWNILFPVRGFLLKILKKM